MALKLPEAAGKDDIKREVAAAYEAFRSKHAREGPFLEYLEKEWSNQIGKSKLGH